MAKELFIKCCWNVMAIVGGFFQIACGICFLHDYIGFESFKVIAFI